MKTITKKDALVETLVENRDRHRERYLEAKEGYLARARRVLEDQLEQIERDEPVSVRVVLEAPEDHTVDYDRALKMLELDVRTEVELNDVEVQNFVLDQWPWFGKFREDYRASTGNVLA